MAISEQDSELALDTWLRASAACVASVTYTEVVAAVVAASRRGRLDSDELERAQATIADTFAEILLYPVNGDLATAAARLAERHGLRGYDAVHLATAIELGYERFITWDRELAQAALAEGISVFPE